MEYDYGAGVPGGLIRKTAFNYQGFSAAPIFPNYNAILDRPCQVITYDSAGEIVWPKRITIVTAARLLAQQVRLRSAL